MIWRFINRQKSGGDQLGRAVDELGGNLLGGSGEEGLGEGLKVLGGSWWLWERLWGWVEVIGTAFSPSQQHLLHLMTQPFANPYRQDRGHQYLHKLCLDLCRHKHLAD